MPLHIHLIKEACLALQRTIPRDSNIPALQQQDKKNDGHRWFCWTAIKKLELQVIKSDRIPTQYIWRQQHQVLKESYMDGKPPKMVPGYFEHDYEIYTDGSGIDNSFGSGLVVYEKKAIPSKCVLREAFCLGEDRSVFQGELFAIKKAAEWILHHCSSKKITICSDSRAALMALDRPRIISQLERETKAALGAAGSLNTITLRWIKSHQGYIGNEAADAEAKRGALSVELLVEDRPAIPEAMVKMKFKLAFTKKWQEYWTNRPDCRQTKIWLPQIRPAISFELLKAGRRKLSGLVQIITGHNFLRRHEALVRETGEAECRLCLEDEETSFHIVAECPALAEPRLRVFGTLCLDAQALQWSSREIASFIREASISSLLDPTEVLGPGLTE